MSMQITLDGTNWWCIGEKISFKVNEARIRSAGWTKLNDSVPDAEHVTKFCRELTTIAHQIGSSYLENDLWTPLHPILGNY
jgi:hypothetical protein